MINLNEVKQQINESIPWRDGVLTVEQARALVEEVEQLRADNAELELGVATMRTRMNNAYQQRNDERAAVVRYMSEGGYVCTECKDIAVSELATGIVRGEHRREREPVEDDSIEYRDIGKED